MEEDVLRLEGGQEEIDGGLNQTYNDGRTILHAKLVSKTTVTNWIHVNQPNTQGQIEQCRRKSNLQQQKRKSNEILQI